ncbi:NAD-dependent epimerase/dehydratase family protein [Rhizobium leguminosarum]|uniref:NAD-dependent epimerase/dehydratase family protein n=1 Tax=Rhizobium leguminosarum TaxID=384 RepID=UPI003F96DFD1
MTTAVVIGPRSMLGSQIIERLQALDIKILTAGRAAADDIFLHLGVSEVKILEGLSADIVFHCAASFADDGDNGHRQNFDINTASAIDVARLVEVLGASVLVYAGSASSDETLDPGNFTSYGLTKGLAEQILAWAAQKQGFRFCSLRFPQIYDTEGRCCGHQAWFGRIIAYASRGHDIRMPRSFGIRNFIHVRDAADLMIRAGHAEITGILNIAHPEAMTCNEIAVVAYDTFGLGGNVIEAPEKAPFRRINFADGSQAFAQLNLLPSIRMKDGIGMIRDAGTSTAFGPMDVT